MLTLAILLALPITALAKEDLCKKSWMVDNCTVTVVVQDLDSTWGRMYLECPEDTQIGATHIRTGSVGSTEGFECNY
jgi:hypothetical protein